jgi:hypothetical protein
MRDSAARPRSTSQASASNSVRRTTSSFPPARPIPCSALRRGRSGSRSTCGESSMIVNQPRAVQADLVEDVLEPSSNPGRGGPGHGRHGHPPGKRQPKRPRSRHSAPARFPRTTPSRGRNSSPPGLPCCGSSRPCVTAMASTNTNACGPADHNHTTTPRSPARSTLGLLRSICRNPRDNKRDRVSVHYASAALSCRWLTPSPYFGRGSLSTSGSVARFTVAPPPPPL